MARLSLILSQQRRMDAYLRAKREGRKLKYATRVYRRCELCARQHGFMRAFGMCRICFRELAMTGQIPGIKKSSW